MIKSIKYLMMMLVVVLFASCDEHREIEDMRNIAVGDILCSDGSHMSLESFQKSGKEAVAVVFDVHNNDKMEGIAYAVSIKEMPAYQFCDSIPVQQQTSADVTAFDGRRNTAAMLATQGATSPIAFCVQSMFPFRHDGYIPSVAEMQLMHSRRDIIDSRIIAIGGDPFPTKAEDCWFWTSTEVSGMQSLKAWTVSLISGQPKEAWKTQPYKVRPVITIYK